MAFFVDGNEDFLHGVIDKRGWQAPLVARLDPASQLLEKSGL